MKDDEGLGKIMKYLKSEQYYPRFTISILDHIPIPSYYNIGMRFDMV